MYRRKWPKPFQRKKKCKKAKWLCKEALHIAEQRKAKGKGERKDIPN